MTATMKMTHIGLLLDICVRCDQATAIAAKVTVRGNAVVLLKDWANER